MAAAGVPWSLAGQENGHHVPLRGHERRAPERITRLGLSYELDDVRHHRRLFRSRGGHPRGGHRETLGRSGIYALYLETNILPDAPRVKRVDGSICLNKPTVANDGIHRDDLPTSQIAPAF